MPERLPSVRTCPECRATFSPWRQSQKWCSSRCYGLSFGRNQAKGRRGRTTVDGRVVRRYVAIAEAALGKPLPAGAIVHHIDGNEQNDVPENLVICENTRYHWLLHVRQRVLEAGGDPNSQLLCGRCRTPKPYNDFARNPALPSGRSNTCKACHNADRRTRRAGACEDCADRIARQSAERFADEQAGL